MTNEEFDALVSKLEQQAIRSPAIYKSKVVLLGLIGYAYLGLVLSLILGLFLSLLASIFYLKAIAIKLAIPVGLVLWKMVKAMWVKIPPPTGRVLQSAEAPALFSLIETLRVKLKAPPFYQVILTGDFNAAVVQLPQLGIFGWYRNYLLIGLPFMKALTPAQFEAVVAHELGHLSYGHGRISTWIYRVRAAWTRLLSALDQQRSWSVNIFRPFLKWYAPYFNAYTFPLARANEYAADAASSRFVSPRAAAEALTSVNVIGSYLRERFWPEIHKQSDELPQPSFAPYSKMSHALTSELDKVAIQKWLDEAMAESTTTTDTHPSLADRLKAIGETPHLALPVSGQGADQLLGGVLADITADFNRKWQEAISPSWGERYRETQEGRRRLSVLETKAESIEALSFDEALERAKLTVSFGAGIEAGVAQCKVLHSQAPDNALVSFMLGQLLLQLDDEAGFPLIERAMELNKEFVRGGCEVLRNYCWRKGHKEEAHKWHDRLMMRIGLDEKATQERYQLKLSDKFDRHGLPDAVIAELQAKLKNIKGLRRAYLVRKHFKDSSTNPYFIFGYSVTPWWSLYSGKRVAQAQQQINDLVHFPGETCVLNVDGDNYRFGRKFRFMRGTRVF